MVSHSLLLFIVYVYIRTVDQIFEVLQFCGSTWSFELIWEPVLGLVARTLLLFTMRCVVDQMSTGPV